MSENTDDSEDWGSLERGENSPPAPVPDLGPLYAQRKAWVKQYIHVFFCECQECQGLPNEDRAVLWAFTCVMN